MLLLAMQPSTGASCCFRSSAFTCHAPKVVAKIPYKYPVFARPKPSFFQPPALADLKFDREERRNTGIYASVAAAVEAVTEETPTEDPISSIQPVKEKLEVVVKPKQKPRLVLKFIWMEKNVGLALDQVIPGHGTIPLSPYYFWPRKDAWEELKVLLESKPWISQKQMIILLNQATDIINLWQQSGGDLS
ncbi:hypothetical protein U1Q18_038774 [Sarracenia purpurea var. burkii]